MKQNVLILLIAIIYHCVCFGNENSQLLQHAIHMFEQEAIDCMNQAQVSGLAIVVTYQEQTIYSKGLGYKNLECSDPVMPDTLFRLASNSKILTAIAILQILEKGLIELDDPVIKHLPWFRQKDPANRWEKITIRQLLNHTAGLMHSEGCPVWENITGYFPSSEEMIPIVTNQEIVATPGSRLKYSNLGYWVLAQMIAKYGGANGQNTDERYVNYIKENILRPLHMDHSGYVCQEKDLLFFAKPYGIIDQITGKRKLLPFVMDPAGLSGGWGFYSSVDDLSKLLLWLTQICQGNGAPLLNHSGSLMISNLVKDPNSSSQYGLGILVREGPNGCIMGHTGWFAGYITQVMVDMNTGIGIAILINTVSESTKPYWNLAFKTIGHALQGLTLELPTMEDFSLAITHPPFSAKFKNIVGRYRDEIWGDELKIYEDASGTLIYDSNSKLSMHLINESPNRLDFKLGWEGFFTNFNGERISIFLDSEGHVEYLILGNTYRCYQVGDLLFEPT